MVESDASTFPQLIRPYQAKTSGKFSSEELLSLKREFQHHKDKIHEYNIVMDTVSRTEGEQPGGPIKHNILN